MIRLVAAALALLAVGYVAGRLRPVAWLFDRALGIATSPDRGGVAWLASVLLVLTGLAVHPRRSLKHIRSWRAAGHREPAPEMDPAWGWNLDPDVCSNCYGTGSDFGDGSCGVCEGTGESR